MLLARGRNNDKDQVRKLQAGLAAFGYQPGTADGIFGAKTEDALEEWQHEADLYPDGIFGKASLAAWTTWCQMKRHPEFLFDQDPPAADPPDTGTRLGWSRVPADAMQGGYDHLILRSDAAVVYKEVYNEVHRLGGVVTTAGGQRSLSSKAGAARSKSSFHYTGRAFDLALPTGLDKIDSDPYIVVRDGDSRKWVVWAKVINNAAPGASEVPSVTLQGVTAALRNGKTALTTTSWTGQAFNLTDLLAKHDFQRISGRKDFFNGGSVSGAEWWHFSWRGGMVEGKTTFGGELLKVYSLAQCQKFIYWDEVKDNVYGVDFFG